MPKITNKRYKLHFKSGEFEVMPPKEFYAGLKEIEAKPYLLSVLKYYFLLLYWTGRRPIEILELKRENFKKTSLLDKEKAVWDEYLKIYCPAKKGSYPVIVYLAFDNVPFLEDLWDWLQGGPPDFLPFYLLHSKHMQIIRWKTKAGIPRERENKNLSGRILYFSKKFFDVPPYFFRHNRFTDVGLKTGDFNTVKAFKGSKTLASVDPYIHRTAEQMRKIAKDYLK